MSELPVVKATDLGKRYRRTWALRDCSLAVPRARVVARPQRRGQDDAPASRGWPVQAHSRRSGSWVGPRFCLRKAAVQRLHGRRDAQVRARAQAGLDHE
jgi:hypothetical protein